MFRVQPKTNVVNISNNGKWQMGAWRSVQHGRWLFSTVQQVQRVQHSNCWWTNITTRWSRCCLTLFITNSISHLYKSWSLKFLQGFYQTLVDLGYDLKFRMSVCHLIDVALTILGIVTLQKVFLIILPWWSRYSSQMKKKWYWYLHTSRLWSEFSFCKLPASKVNRGKSISR